MKQYLKFVMQVVATGIMAVIAGLADQRLDTAEWINVGLAVLGSVGVLGAGNLPSGVWAHTKAIVSAATAALVALTSFLADGGLSGTEVLQIVVAVLGTFGVLAVPGPRVVTESYANAVARGRGASGLSNGPVV